MTLSCADTDGHRNKRLPTTDAPSADQTGQLPLVQTTWMKTPDELLPACEASPSVLAVHVLSDSPYSSNHTLKRPC